MPKITKYEEWKNNGELDNKLLLIEAWARDGLTDKQISKNLGISEFSFYEYKNKYPMFSKALKKGKEVVDIEVENALYKKALGYSVIIKKAFKLREILYKDGKKTKEFERIEYADEEVHIPADTTAQIFWLKNRKKEQWREKQEYSTDEELSKLDKLLEEQKNAYMDN